MFGRGEHAVEQLPIEIDDDTVERLDKVAPARSPQRSAFIRAAIQRAPKVPDWHVIAIAGGSQKTATLDVADPEPGGVQGRRREDQRDGCPGGLCVSRCVT